MTMNLLTEPEAAKLLRCSPSKVKRLRLSGKLTFIPGRPVLIDEADIAAFLVSIKEGGRPDGKKAAEAATGAKEGNQSTISERDARAWALREINKPRRRRAPAVD